MPAAALMLGAAHGAQIGINFQDNYNGTSYAAMTDSVAFGIPLANWINAPSIFASDFNPISTNSTFTLPGGGNLGVAWSCKNTWSLSAAVPTAGDDQVIYGYLDDTDYGYTVKLSGLRAFASSFTITTIASTDNGTSFQDVNVTSTTETNTLQYLNNYTPSFAAGLAGTSVVSSAFVTLNGNDSITIRGLARASNSRSTLAGIIIDYTPGTSNPPLIEADPQAPTNAIYPGGTISLAAAASGAPTLHYQWRKGGVEISGATDATYSKSNVAVSDSGNYDIVVTNNYGAITSKVAVVTVLNVVSPVITKGPLSQTFYASYPVTFSVEAIGGSLTYQWKTNGVNIPGATSASYTIASITPANAATYTVDVNNPVGPVASASATLTVKTTSSAYEAAVVTTRPLLYYRLNDSVTTPTFDYSATNSGSLGSAGNGSYFNATRLVAGAIVAQPGNAAVNFPGAGSMKVPFQPELNVAGPFTFEFWTKPAAAASGCVASSITLGNSGWLFYNSTLVAGQWSFRTIDGTSVNQNTSGGTVTPNVWQHVVGVWDGAANHLYVNGVEVANTPTSTFLPNGNSTLPLTLGVRSDGAFQSNGSIDEAAYYTNALSAAQVLAHYQNGTNASPGTPYQNLVTGDGAVGYWRLGEGYPPYATAVNSGTFGVAASGSYQSGVTNDPAGPQSPALPGFGASNPCGNFDGASGQVRIPATGTLSDASLTSVTEGTFLCWVKRNGAQGAYKGLVAMRPLSTGLYLKEDDTLNYAWNDAGNTYGFDSGLIPPDGEWTMAAVVVQSGRATFYMGSVSGGLVSAVNTVTHTPANFTTGPFGIGADIAFGGTDNRFFNGSIDEAAVYNRALSASEINTLYLIGTGTPFKLGIVPGGIIQDTKPLGTPHHGVNVRGSAAWVASNTDAAATPVTRNGVEQFSAATPSQIVIPANADFESPVGTICFWIRANAPLPGPGNEGAMLMDHRTSAGTDIVLNNAGAIFVQCSGGANSFSAGYIPDDLWHHVAVTYDQSASGSVEIFVDGASLGSQVNTAAWSWPVAQRIELGTSHDPYWERLDGLMDDFRIYSRVLTSTEIGSIKTSDGVVNDSALKVRYNFGTAGIGNTVTFPFGTLLSSPTLGPSAVWTPVTGASAPAYPFLPTAPAQFFRATP